MICKTSRSPQCLDSRDEWRRADESRRVSDTARTLVRRISIRRTARCGHRDRRAARPRCVVSRTRFGRGHRRHRSCSITSRRAQRARARDASSCTRLPRPRHCGGIATHLAFVLRSGLPPRMPFRPRGIRPCGACCSRRRRGSIGRCATSRFSRRAPLMTSARRIRSLAATPADVPDLQALIRALADYERLAHLCVATERFGGRGAVRPHPAAEVLIAREWGKRHCGGICAVFPHFLDVPRPARPVARGPLRRSGGIAARARPRLLARARRHRPRARLRPLRMGGARLERAGDRVLRGAWARRCCPTGGSPASPATRLRASASTRPDPLLAFGG